MNMDDPFEMDAHQMRNELIVKFWGLMGLMYPNFNGLGQNDKVVAVREVLKELFRYAMGRYIDPNLDVDDEQRRMREHDIDNVILERDEGVVRELAPDEDDEDDDNLNFILDHPQIAGLSCAVVRAMNHAGGRRRTRKGKRATRRHRGRSHRRHRRRH